MSDLQNEIFLFAGNGFVYNYCNQSLCRDWSSTGLFLFDNLQTFKSEISSEHDD